MAEHSHSTILSRRTALAGIAAFTAAPAAATPLTEIGRRLAAWRRDRDAMHKAYDDAGVAADALGDGPSTPESLLKPIMLADGSLEEPDPHWHLRDLAAIIDRGGAFGAETVDHGDGSSTLRTFIKPLAPGELGRVSDMLAICRSYEISKREYIEACDACAADAVQLGCDTWDEGLAILATPAVCLPDIAHKVEIIVDLEIPDGGFSKEANEALQVVWDDIRRLAA